ncbi:MAG: flagellar basal body P-ring protein FlgI [Burkholderiales bacterium]
MFALGRLCLIVFSFMAACNAAMAQQRIKDLTGVQGVRPNQLVGYGLIVGLDGTGDQTTQTPFTTQAMASMLAQLGIQLPPGQSLQLKNVAAVIVTSNLPPFASPGQQIDVTVSSIGNAKSLRGGTLLMTPLKGADGRIYAVAQGNVLIAGAGGGAAGTSVQINTLNAGRIPSGATVERSVPTAVGQGEFVTLEMHTSDFTTASRVAQVINKNFGGAIASAVNARQIRVRAPEDVAERVEFIARVEGLPVVVSDSSPKVIVNARTGSVVMNQMVTVSACAVAHGNLTVTISTENVVSQPNALATGQTTTVEQSQVQVKSDKGGLVVVPNTVSLNEVVKALNAMGATPQDLLAILQAMKAAGALRAELEII